MQFKRLVLALKCHSIELESFMSTSIEQLVAFVTVYEQRSFSKAAVQLGKHRTTTGQVIANMEDTLAVELFERIGRNVEPTEEGHLLYHYAKSTIAQSDTFDKIALSLSFGGMESVNFAHSSIIPQPILAAIRTQLAEDFPSMKVNFLIRSKTEIEQGLESGDIHFGLVNIDQAKGIYGKDVTFIGYMELVPFVKKGSPMSKLPASKVLSAMRTSRQFVLSTFIEEGLKGKIVISADNEQIDQFALAVKLIQTGLGWGWLPKMLKESQYITDNLEPVMPTELKHGLKISFALWNPHSKHILTIKQSVIKAIDEYVEHYKALQKEDE